jgi:vacuolar-type H+-ATPase subunit I/STV1
MRPLYEITNEYKALIREIEDCEELSDDQIAQLDSVNIDIKEKVINVASFIKNLEAESEAIVKAMESMEVRRKRLENKTSKLKDYLKMNMEFMEIKEVKSPYFNVKVLANPVSVSILAEDEIPLKYKKEITLMRLDKLMIRDELKNHVPVPGAMLEQKTRLEIR